jgi:hypothetical protein
MPYSPVDVQWKVSTGKYPPAMKIRRRLAEQDVPIEAKLKRANP